MKNKYLLVILIVFIFTNSQSIAIDETMPQIPTIKASSKKVFSFRQFYLGLDEANTNGYFTIDANNYIKKGNFEKASKSISKALYFYDKNPLTYILKAEIEFHNNNINEAKNDYDMAEQILNENKRIDADGRTIINHDDRLYGLYTQNTMWERLDKGYAKIALKENNLQEANKIIDYITDNWMYLDEEIFKIKSEILKAEGNDELSLVYADAFNTLSLIGNIDKNNPNHADAYYQRALALYEVGEKGFALNSINKAINLK